MSVAGQVAVVTGASRGIGAAIARALAAAGAHVVVGYRSQASQAKVVVDDIVTRSGSAEALAFDVATASEVEQAMRDVVARLGKIDVLVNNAGVSSDALILRTSDEQWQRVLDVNLKGVFNCTKSVARPMMRARAGRIVNVSSVVGFTGNVGQAAYAAAKAGIIGFTKALAQENAKKGITVNAVCPGYIDTDMVADVPPKVLEGIVAQIPVGRLGKASEIASLVVYLASDDAAFITGAVLSANGGQYLA